MSLPNGYKRLEYIQSSGTQYVDSGFIPNQDTRVEVECALVPSTKDTRFLLGSRSAASLNEFQIATSDGYYRTDYNKTHSNLSNISYGNEKFYIDKDKNVTNLNNEYSATETYSSFSCPVNLYIFGTNSNGSFYNGATAKVYTCKIYDNGTLIRDYIPCQTTSGDIGLWDDVNSVFYGNAGTGTFEAGPEVGVATPKDFRLSSSTETTATLAWSAVDGATGYKLYRDGILIATLTDTSYVDSVRLFTYYVYALTAYNDDGESAAATLTYYAAPENLILYLVTDRTAADVAAQNDKGTYNASDLNRVETAVAYLAELLVALPDELKSYAASKGVAWDAFFDVPYDPSTYAPTTKTDWAEPDIPTTEQMTRYLDNIKALRNALDYATDPLPDGMDDLSWQGANAIEKALVGLDTAAATLRAATKADLDNTASAWFYSGEIYANEV